MSIDTAGNLRVLLDTNIIISAIGFGGKPAQILLQALEGEIQAVISPILLAELQDVLNKKLVLSDEDIKLALEEIEDSFQSVYPRSTINIVKDDDDNRVLEAAIEGNCEYIITGDKELLNLREYKDIHIVTADEFLNLCKTS